MFVSLVVLAEACAMVAADDASPIAIALFDEFATFANSQHPNNRIGYRFHEHTPLVFGTTPPAKAPEQAQRDQASEDEQTKTFANRPGMITYRRLVTEDGWIPQTWTYLMTPVADGIDLLLVVETADVGLPEYFGIQQCFRLTGATNEEWRHKYALTPAFSEYDLWAQPTDAGALPSLSWVLQDGALRSLPARKEAIGFRTIYGKDIDERITGGHIQNLARVGAYDAEMLGTADNGIILRTSADRAWSCGIYWERSTHLTDHHPADCLHAIVNIGGVPAHSKRVLRGKIYWLRGGGEKLIRHWRADFPEPNQ